MGWQAVLRKAQGSPVPVDRLETALRARWPEVEVEDVTLLEGGLGSVLHLVGLRGAPVATVVLRQLLVEFGDDADAARQEVRVHQALQRQAIPVPSVHWSDATGNVLGRPALLLDAVPGSLLITDLRGQAAREAFAGVVTGMTAVGVEDLGFLPVLDDVEAHVLRFGAPPDSDIVDAARINSAIAAHGRWFRPVRQLVHADLHGGNILWNGTRVTGVLDWPGAAIGNTLFDEAYAWLDTVLAHDRSTGDALQDEIDRQRAGPAPSEGEVALWRACALNRALPTPAPWAEAYRAAGLDITDDEVEARFVRLVEDELAGS